MRIHIIRHADPDYANHTITAAGHLEAAALAKRLNRTGIDRIYSSPYPRAIHTAQYTADAAQLEIDVQPWMAELASWDIHDSGGKPMAAWNVDGEMIRHEQPFTRHSDWNDWGPFQPWDLQSKFDELAQNSDRFMSSLGYAREGGTGKYRITRHPNIDRIAVFCHLGFGLTWIAHLLDLPLPLVWSGFWKAPSSVTTILMDERSADWATPRCIGMGDISHLYEADLPVSRQGIIANFD